MKRYVFLTLVLFILVIFSACGGGAVQSAADSTPVPTYEDGEDQDFASRIMIGFSIAGNGAFYEQLVLDFEKECDTMNYDMQIKTADSAVAQQADINTLLTEGASVIVIEPVDVDALETVLAECETQNVPVISILDQINGHVSMLISANYSSMGTQAGELAVDVLGETGGGCVMLKTDYDSFVMQWMSDGFIAAIDTDKDVSLVVDKFCGDDEEQAYAVTSAALQDDSIGFIFAQSPAIGRGALRAVKESGRDIEIVVCGADMDIVESVQAGDINTALFYGPGALAQQTVYYADKLAKDASYQPPQFEELGIDVITAENAAEYIVEGAIYAQTAE